MASKCEKKQPCFLDKRTMGWRLWLIYTRSRSGSRQRCEQEPREPVSLPHHTAPLFRNCFQWVLDFEGNQDSYSCVWGSKGMQETDTLSLILAQKKLGSSFLQASASQQWCPGPLVRLLGSNSGFLSSWMTLGKAHPPAETPRKHWPVFGAL